MDTNSASAWNRHPNPMLKREKWCSLNGEWLLNGQGIQVPFPPQSDLSGYAGDPGDGMLYEKRFVLPEGFDQSRVILHFGAVDQIAKVYLNGVYIGAHEGGYLPFSFDITDVLHHDGENCLRVEATDALDHTYPYGKQTRKRGGMWYTPVSGIWQSVWLENVPDQYIRRLAVTPDLGGVEIEAEGVAAFDVQVSLGNGEVLEKHIEGRGRIDICESGHAPQLWTPENPHLYTMKVTAGEDHAESYFALRTVSIEDKNGVQRVCLNGKPIFMHGVLDQGYFPEGIYLPGEEAEYERDILRMKGLGINLLRKHIKIEPACFYEACDRLGMLVMQDMVNNGDYSFIRDTALPTIGFKRRRDDRADIDSPRCRMFIRHMEETVRHLYNHPSIVAYTIFNEGWGQFHSDAMYRRLKKLDGTRLVDSTSGWFAQQENDFDSEHIYFRVIDLKPGKRPLLVSECGGYTLAVSGHCFSSRRYGYGACRDGAELTGRIENMYRRMILPAIKDGLCGCIYTQLSDVEDEVNGLYTYDRKVCKVDTDRMLRLAEEMHGAIEVYGRNSTDR